MNRPTSREIGEAVKKYEEARNAYFKDATNETKKEAFSAESRNIEALVKRNDGPLYAYYND